MFRTRTVCLLAILVAALAAPAQAGIFDRARQIAAAAGAGNQVLGTAITNPMPVPGGLEYEVYVFTPTPGRPLTLVRFPGSDTRRVATDVRIGSTVIVFTSDALAVNGESVVVARRWRAKVEGSTEFAQRYADFLTSYRTPILAYAFRNRPETLKRVFAGNLGALQQLSTELAALEGTMRRLGIESLPPLDVQAEDIPLP